MTGVNILCADAIVTHEDRVLLVQRAHEPNKGLWALPGGRVGPGEDAFTAALRELHEETKLEVNPRGHRRPWSVEKEDVGDGRFHQIVVYVLPYEGGEPTASEESMAVAWFPFDALPADMTRVHSILLLNYIASVT